MYKIKYLIFSAVFVYTFLWTQISLTISSLCQNKTPITVIQNTHIQELISDRTGLQIQSIKISESPKPFGMMVGIPTRPQLILSRGLYESFNSQETEYVVLHEAGHYLLYHGLIEFLAGLTSFVTGIFLLKKINNPTKTLFLSVFLGLIFGIIMIQLGKIHEIQADKFAVNNISDPNGMIQATIKFRDYHGKKYSQNNNPVLQFLFYRANPYENRINMVQQKINER